MSPTQNRPGSQLVLEGGSLITGDGKTHLESASIRIRDGMIVEITQAPIEASNGETVVSTKGYLMLPGFINGHAHATIAGPSMPSGSLPPSLDVVRYQRNRHLLSGTTSLINVCGLALPEDRDGALEPHALDIHMTSAHTPHSLAAADQIDGQGSRRLIDQPGSRNLFQGVAGCWAKLVAGKHSAVVPRTIVLSLMPSKKGRGSGSLHIWHAN